MNFRAGGGGVGWNGDGEGEIKESRSCLSRVVQHSGSYSLCAWEDCLEVIAL